MKSLFEKLLFKQFAAIAKLDHQRRQTSSFRFSERWGQWIFKCLPTIGLATVILGTSSPVQAGVIRNFASRFSKNDTGDIQIVGNTLLTCPTSASGCTNAQNGGGTGDAANNNGYGMVNVDVDSDSTTFNSSRATLNLPAGSTVLWAGLYWGARTTAPSGGNAAPNPILRNSVQFATPASGTYNTISASPADVYIDTISGAGDYQSFANVTSLVQAGGSGTYTAANVQAATGQDREAGWALVVVYRDSTQPARNLTVFDGFASVSNSTGNRDVTFNVSGFTTPPSGAVNVRIGTVAYEGDLGATGDSLKFNTQTLTNSLNPATNFFNSSITRLGSRLTAKEPNYTNQLGFDIDVISPDNTNKTFITNGATSASINLTTTSETYYPGVVTTAIDIYSPQVAGNVTKNVTDLNGGTVLPGDILEYTITVANTGQDGATNNILTDPIPANTTYEAGSLQITAGANTGAKTDTTNDDQANYDSANNRVVFRLGTGATATAGGTLAPSASTTLKFRVKVNSSTSNNTTISNQATVDYTAQTLGNNYTTQSDGDTATAGIQPTNIVVRIPDLTLAKSHTGNFIRGASGIYTITATNSGSAATSGTVTVSDTLPAGLTPIAANGTGWNCTTSGQTVTCARSDALNSGQSYPPITITTTVAQNAAASLTNTATVSGGGEFNTNNNSANDPTTIVSSADLSLAMVIDNPDPDVGQNITYTVTVNNAGPTTATNVAVTNQLPAGLTFVSATPSQGTYNQQTGIWSVGNLTISGSATLQVVTTVNTTKVIVNKAEVSASDQPDPDSTPGNNVSSEDDQASITVPASPPRLRLIKRITAINGNSISGFVDYVNSSDSLAADDNAPNWPVPASTYLRGKIDGGAVKPGDEVEYTIYFLSDGSRPATNIQVCDLVPTSTTFISNAFNKLTPTDGGLGGTDSGIALALSNTSIPTEPTVYLSNIADTDRGQFFLPGATLPNSCLGSNNNGAVVVNVVTKPTTLPNANSPGSPANSYGFIRFRVKIN